MAPIIPYLSDSSSQLEATVRSIAETGAVHLVPIVLHLRPGAREWFMAWLAEQHPALVERYGRLYARGSYAPKAYQDEITRRVHALARLHGIGKTSPRDARRVRRPHLAPAYAATPQQLAML